MILNPQNIQNDDSYIHVHVIHTKHTGNSRQDVLCVLRLTGKCVQWVNRWVWVIETRPMINQAPLLYMMEECRSDGSEFKPYMLKDELYMYIYLAPIKFVDNEEIVCQILFLWTILQHLSCITLLTVLGNCGTIKVGKGDIFNVSDQLTRSLN